MKRLLTQIFLIAVFSPLYSQINTPYDGKVHAELFTDFHYNLNDTTTGFGINRALVGYSFVPKNNFTATVIVNIGSPDDLAAGSEPRRYIYFREAFLSYVNDRLSLNMGIVKTHITDYTTKFIGKRYVANTLQSINEYGYLADLGVLLDYKLSDAVEANFGIMNGEGYNNLQNDNNLKVSAGLYIQPDRSFALRLFGDVIRREGFWQSTLICFAGFKNERFSLAGDITYKTKPELVESRDAWGLSTTGAIKIVKNTEIFGRYDYSATIDRSGEFLMPEEYLHDYNFAVAGFQYTLSESVKLALDYQGTYETRQGNKVSDAIYLNALFKF
jgi:hypothetical protein